MLPNQAENVIPDCLNLGVIAKVFLSVNFAVYLALLTRGDGWWVDTLSFFEASSLVEIICMSSLLCLSVLRKTVIGGTVSPAWQRILCGLVPASISALLLLPMSHVDWFSHSFPHMNEELMVLCAFLAGLFFQWYFELRARAFSPALNEARLQALQARIRPHFLFNSLNAVLSLIRSDPKRAETVLEDLADLFRVLMRDTRSMSTVYDEMALCKQYLAIEQVRLGERLQVQWNLHDVAEQDLQGVEIPALLLQPLLENAVRYGVEPVPEMTCIVIDIHLRRDKIHFQICNPCRVEVGAKGEQKIGNKMALDNIRNRLDLLYDLEAQLRHQVRDQQFILEMYFPVRRP